MILFGVAVIVIIVVLAGAVWSVVTTGLKGGFVSAGHYRFT